MPTSVADAFAAAGLTRDDVVRWGTKPSIPLPGVYIVSLSASADGTDGSMMSAPIAIEVFERWLDVRPELTLEGVRPTVEQLMDRVRQFWLKDEVILYIGKATSLSSRVGQYYRTPIGARRPHAGGYFLKLLSNLDQLWVHYAACDHPSTAEDSMLESFCEGVSVDSRRELLDPAHPFPFANLEWPQGIRKAHGLRGAREPRQSPSTKSYLPLGANPMSQLLSTPPLGAHRTQRVTAMDLESGRIRIPARGSSPTKLLFPSGKATLDVMLRGRSVSARWDPRMGPDRERSGVLRIGTVLSSLVREDEVLMVSEHDGGGITVN